jgi:hypothetical protein
VTPEPYPLTNAYWKIERAQEHLESLDVAVKRYLSPDAGEPSPYSISSHEEPEDDAVCYRVEINHPHVYLFLLAGDAVQCLRSALDHAVWSLARLKFSDPDWTEFPIFSSVPNADRRRRFKSKLRGLSDRAIEYIESLQPYNRPAGIPLGTHPLFQLHEINRIDKHRQILVRTVMSGLSTSAFGVSLPGDDFLWKAEPTDYGYEVRRFGRYKNLKPNILLLVVFGERKSGITIPLAGLWDIYEYVRDTILPTLSGFAQQAN